MNAPVFRIEPAQRVVRSIGFSHDFELSGMLSADMRRYSTRAIRALAAGAVILGGSFAGGNDVRAEPDSVSGTAGPSVQLEPAQRPGASSRPAPRVQASSYEVQQATWDLGGSAKNDYPSNRQGFHPAVRVLVRTKLLSGKRASGNLGPDALLAQTRRAGYWPFRLCFEQELRENEAARGTAVLRFSVGRKGQVTYVRRMQSPFSQTGMACLRRAIYGLKYRATPRSRADAEVQIQLSPGDVRLPRRDEAVPVMLRQADALAAARLPLLGQCYEGAQRADPGIWGRVTLVLRLGARGEVQHAAVQPSSWAPRPLAKCIERAFDGAKVPGVVGEVQVALRFGTAPGASGS